MVEQIFDLLGGFGGPSPSATSAGIPNITAFNREGLNITFAFNKQPGAGKHVPTFFVFA